MSVPQAARRKRGSVSVALARDRLGVPAVLSFVLASVAPLTVAAGVIPTAYQTTGLTGIPAAFIVIAVILAVFAVGYVAMTRHITNSGAFYEAHMFARTCAGWRLKLAMFGCDREALTAKRLHGGALGTELVDLLRVRSAAAWLPGRGRSLRSGPVAVGGLVSVSAILFRLLFRACVCWAGSGPVVRVGLAAVFSTPVRLLGDYFISSVGKVRPTLLRFEFDDAYCQVSETFAELDPERLHYRNEEEKGCGGQFQGRVR